MEDNVIRYTSKDKKIILFSCHSREWKNKLIANTYDEKEGGKLIFENDVLLIPEDAFSENKMLKTIELPPCVVSIGSHAFFRSGLEKVSLSDCLTTIGAYAFAETKLRKVLIPNSTNHIECFAFSNCKNLERITFERLDAFVCVVEIGAYAFMDCPLKYLSFPMDANVYISDTAFYHTPVMKDKKARSRLLDFISYTSENTLQFK